MNRTKLKRTGYLTRRIDFFIGIALVFVLGWTRYLLQGKRTLPNKIQRIAILQTAAIGDTILMSSVWQDIRESFPEAHITVFVGESNFDIACLLFGSTNVSLLPVKRPIVSLLRCRKESVDVVLDFGPWPRWNALLALAIKARWRAGFKTEGQYRHFGYDIAVLHSKVVHELENHRSLASSLKITPHHAPHVPEEVLNGDKVQTSTSRRVILHPWSGGFMGHHKEWPTERWVELARRLSLAGFEVELSGGPADRQDSKELALLMQDAGLNVHECAGKFTLREMLKQIRSAYAVISVNTGIMHLASACGVLTIGLNGPSPVRRWGAVGKRAFNVESTCAGCGFLDLGFEYPKLVPPCMQAITVDQVWNEFQSHQDQQRLI